MADRNFWHTTRAHKALSVADKSIRAEHFYQEDGVRKVLLPTHDPARGESWIRHNRPAFVTLGDETEIFPGIRVLVTRASMHRKVRIRLTAPEGLPITPGYPHERTPRLVRPAA